MMLFNDPKSTNYQELSISYPTAVAALHHSLMERQMWVSDEMFMDLVDEALKLGINETPRTAVLSVVYHHLRRAHLI